MSYCTDIFQRNMLDCFLDQPNKKFKLVQYQITDQLCFEEFLSLYYIDSRPLESTERNCQPVVLNDEIIEFSHIDPRISKAIPLVSVKEKRIIFLHLIHFVRGNNLNQLL